MCDFDDEFYNEPSEFDIQVDEFKQSLLNAVKDEYKAEMERLRVENAELQYVRDNFDQIKNEYKAKERELQLRMNDAQREARGARLNELLKNYEVTLYSARYKYKTGPKCDKCNDQRNIEFFSPSGKKMTEKCSCAEHIPAYEPEENILKEFRKRDSYGSELIVWYQPYRDDDDGFTYSSSTVARTVYENGMDYSELNQHGTFFRDIEDCRKYCDWLTAEAAKEASHG